jgi:hypothetical protein
MVHTRDPPNDERKRSVRKLGRGLGRNLVNRRTFMIAVRVIILVERIAKLVNWLFSHF